MFCIQGSFLSSIATEQNQSEAYCSWFLFPVDSTGWRLAFPTCHFATKLDENISGKFNEGTNRYLKVIVDRRKTRKVILEEKNSMRQDQFKGFQIFIPKPRKLRGVARKPNDVIMCIKHPQNTSGFQPRDVKSSTHVPFTFSARAK